MTITRPLLRYHGGKFRLAPWILSHFPEHRVYVEPFGGAGSVLLLKPRSYAEVYNDLDGDVVNLFRVVRDRGEDLRHVLALTPFARAEHEQATLPSNDPLEAARRLVVRAFMGFGSNGHNSQRKTGFRANSTRSGTTPAHDWANFPPALQAIIERFQGVVIEHRPAIQVMQTHDSPETLHYCDPPYVPETRSQLAHSPSCYVHEMTVDDHRELADYLHTVEGMVVLSGYDCALYQDLYAGWRTVQTDAMADGARPRIETLWLSPNILIQQLHMEDLWTTSSRR